MAAAEKYVLYELPKLKTIEERKKNVRTAKGDLAKYLIDIKRNIGKK